MTTYVVGLPVVVTVDRDGTIVTVDLAELADSIGPDEATGFVPPADDLVDAHREVLRAWVATHTGAVS